MKWNIEEVIYPCRNCVYFKVCGDNMRTEPCKGRKTKSDLKKEKKNDLRQTQRNCNQIWNS